MERINVYSDDNLNLIGEVLAIKTTHSIPKVKIIVHSKNVNNQEIRKIMQSAKENLSTKFPALRYKNDFKFRLEFSKEVNNIERNSFNDYKRGIDGVVLKNPKLIKASEKLQSISPKPGSIVENQLIPSYKKVLPSKPKVKLSIPKKKFQQNLTMKNRMQN